MSNRPSIPVKVQVSVAIAQAMFRLICPLCQRSLTEDEPRVLEHMTPRATRIALGQEPDAPDNLRWVHKSCADRKTNGNEATCADGDTHKIAKGRRLHIAQMAKEEVETRVGADPGFRLKKKMDGSVVKVRTR